MTKGENTKDHGARSLDEDQAEEVDGGSDEGRDQDPGEEKENLGCTLSSGEQEGHIETEDVSTAAGGSIADAIALDEYLEAESWEKMRARLKKRRRLNVVVDSDDE